MTASSRDHALAQITSFVREYNLTAHDLLSCLQNAGAATASDEGAPSSLLQKVMLYIGGTFVFVGIAVYVGMIWDDIGSLPRVIITLGTGFVAYVLGLVAMDDKKYDRAATPLFLIGAALQPAGLFVLLDEYFPSTHDVAKAAMLVFGTASLQHAATFLARPRTSLAFFALTFFYVFLSALMGKLEIEGRDVGLAISTSGLLISYGLIKTPHAGISPFGFFCSSIIFAATMFDYLHETAFDVLLIAVVAAMMWLSVKAKSRTLLTIGVLTLLAYLGYFTDEYFTDIVGWPIALIVMGLIMIGVSSFALKLGKTMREG
jgi:uncharacterized membrane protein